MQSKLERLLAKNCYFLTRGHDYVEIGGVKWATMNIGAEKPTDIGLYFQWGDTQGYTASQVGTGSGQKPFYWDDYKYYTLDTSQEGDAYESGKITKYNSIDGKMILDASDDAVHVNWGGAWRMPTEEEYVALSNAVNITWTSNYQGSGVAGLVLTDKTDSSKVLFFPAAGRCSHDSVDSVGGFCYYWYSSRGGVVGSARGLNSGFVGWHDIYSFKLFHGFAVRGVLD